MKPGIYLEEALKDVLRTSNFVHGMTSLQMPLVSQLLLIQH